MKLATVVTTITLVYWGILFTLTHIPVEQVPDTKTNDKLLHFIAYFLLAVMVGAQLLVTKRWNRFFCPIAILVLIFFAGFDELTQLLVGRSAEWQDWRADLVGIFAGTIGFTILTKFFRQQPDIQALLDPTVEKNLS